MHKRWLMKAMGLAAGTTIFATACGQALGNVTPKSRRCRPTPAATP